MSLKKKIIDGIIETEAGYVNDPSDSGGETNFGITIAVARTFGYTGEMRDLPREIAFNIYAAKYWDSVKADNILLMSESITAEVVDTAVNTGPSRAGKFLQRSLNVLNNRGRLYQDIAVDGLIGWDTLDTLSEYLAQRDEAILFNMLNCLQGAFYVELAERREKDEKFIYGWFKHRVT